MLLAHWCSFIHSFIYFRPLRSIDIHIRQTDTEKRTHKDETEKRDKHTHSPAGKTYFRVVYQSAKTGESKIKQYF